MLPSDAAHTNFHRNVYAWSVLYRFRDIASYLSKVINVSYPTCSIFGAPLVEIPLEYHQDVWH